MAILITIIGFGIMIFLHELGHFITAKRFGVLVHEFSIGMGPKIFSFGKGETKYSLRLLPLGGFVKLEGENDLEENDNPRSFSNLKPLKRIVVLFSGAFMNILLGFLIFTFINMQTGVMPSKVKGIPEELASKQVNFQVGDEIIKLNDTRTHTFDDVSLYMSRYDKETIDVTIERDGKTVFLDDAKLIKTESGYKLGVLFGAEDASLLKSAEYAVYDTGFISKSVVLAVYDLITGRESINSLSGPVEIVAVVDNVTSEENQNESTYLTVLMFFAAISVNLGIFNLIPFPALDGGSILFALYELITRKKVKSEIVGYASLIGFALLMILAVFVTAGDVMALFK